MQQTIHDALAEQGIRPATHGGRHAFWRAGDHKTLCPRCSATRKKSTDPCLSVSITEDAGGARAVWHCHHCEWSGWTGTGRYQRIRDAAAPKVYRRPQVTVVPPQKVVLDWLASRGIPKHIVERMGIFAARIWMPQSQEKETVVCFPYRKGGEIVNVKYREPARKWFRQEKDAEPVPYNLDAIDGAEEIYIVEGEIDVLSLLVVGAEATISVPDGAPAKPVAPDSPKFDWIESAHAALEAAKRVIVAVDADGPGRALQAELIRRVGRHKCWVVDWPEIEGRQINDANAMLLAAGEEALRAALDEARPVPIEGEVTVHDVWRDVEAMHAGGTVEWTSTGYPTLDPHYRILRKQITVVTGYPHEGKSSVLDQIAVNLAVNHGWRFAVFSPETPVADHVVNLIEKTARAPFFDGPTPRLSLDEVRTYRAFLDRHWHFIRWERKPGQRGRPTIEWLIGQVEYMVRRYGIDGFVLDPYNRVQPNSGAFQRETDFVAELLDELQGCAQRNNLHIWIVAHPAKQLKDRGGKRPERLTLQDISGSAHFDNMTDMGLLVRRIWTNPATGEPYEPHQTPVEVECLKARNKHSGRKGGKALFRWRLSDGTYHAHDGLHAPPAPNYDDPPP